MDHEGCYKIIDLGFSKKLEISEERAEIKGTTLGTVTTMAPEVMSRKNYGLKADIWSIGVIFFQMIFGQMPYDSVSAKQRYE
jgi:serine/threonine protein kinase